MVLSGTLIAVCPRPSGNGSRANFASHLWRDFVTNRAKSPDTPEGHDKLRFRIEADPAEPLVVSDGAHAVPWVAQGEVARRNPSESRARMGRETVR
jgi:hypothetical protein